MKAYIVTLELTGLKPSMWRKVIFPAGATFYQLHAMIQEVTNFQSLYIDEVHHLYEFRLPPEENFIVTNDPHTYAAYQRNKKKKGAAVVKKPQSVKVDAYLEKYGELHYTYDFGDNWAFIVKIDDIVDDYYFGYPTLLGGEGDAPPEDVGGIPGFAHFMEVIQNPKNLEYEEMMAWAKSQSFRRYDPIFINDMLKHRHYKKTEWDKIDHVNYVVKSDRYRQNKTRVIDEHLLFDYITACTNLYGIVPLEKVVEILNSQNPDQLLSERDAALFLSKKDVQKTLAERYVYPSGLDFVFETIYHFEEEEKFKRLQQGKPYYIPEKEELLRYSNNLYIEQNNALDELKHLIARHFMGGDQQRAREELMDEVAAFQIEEDVNKIITGFLRKYPFESEKDLHKALGLLLEVSNHTRLWSNRGHTPAELLPYERLQPLKTRRNDPCPCGSGQKYKKCCG